MRKRNLEEEVIREAREYSNGAVLFHQAVGDLLGVNSTDMKCLDLMMVNGSGSPTQLAEFTGLSTGSTTAMIDRMERAKLLERQDHPTDRRGTVIVVTSEANRRLQTLFGSMAGAMQALLSGYSERELELLADFFSRASALWNDERMKLMAQADTTKAQRQVSRYASHFPRTHSD